MFGFFTSDDSAPKLDSLMHPFVPAQPKLLVIVAYQRSGSTFFGNLFNSNPEAFYIYEPLDSLYGSMYGTRQGWNVPTDITTYQNGSERVVPRVEVEMVSGFLQRLLHCNIDSLPTEALVHRYMFIMPEQSAALKPYIDCYRQRKYNINVRRFIGTIPWRYCGERFGQESVDRLTECNRMLTDEEYRRKQNPKSNVTKMFERYLKYRTTMRLVIDKNCTPLFTKACSYRSLRVTKVVRATMDSMQPLLRSVPNFRVIHLLRDPRAVVLSRRNFLSSGGLFTGVDRNGSMILEAQLYCRTVVNDIRTRLELEKEHPGKILTIVYEDLVQNFKTYAENIYRFMDSPISNNTSSWIEKSDAGEQNSTEIAHKWKRILTYQEHVDIWNGCKEFYQMTNYKWPH